MSYWKVSRHGQHQLGALEVTGDATDVTPLILRMERSLQWLQAEAGHTKYLGDLPDGKYDSAAPCTPDCQRCLIDAAIGEPRG